MKCASPRSRTCRSRPGRRSRRASITSSRPTIAAIGEKYGKTNGQVILRWLLQRGIVAIPKSVHKERMAENFDVFDFELSDAGHGTMASLDKHESQFFDHRDPTAIVSIFGQSLRALRS